MIMSYFALWDRPDKTTIRHITVFLTQQFHVFLNLTDIQKKISVSQCLKPKYYFRHTSFQLKGQKQNIG